MDGLQLMENPIFLMDDLGVKPPHLRKHPYGKIKFKPFIFMARCTYEITSRYCLPGGGGSVKNRKPIGIP